MRYTVFFFFLSFFSYEGFVFDRIGKREDDCYQGGTRIVPNTTAAGEYAEP
jgi:hypothetical protein